MKVAAIVVALCADVVFSASIDKRQAGGIGAILGKAQSESTRSPLACIMANAFAKTKAMEKC